MPAQERLSQATAALFGAVELNDMAAVERSLKDGADIEAKNPNGKTALDLAVDMGHFRIAHFLLAHRNGAGTAEPAKVAEAPEAAEPAEGLKKTPAPAPARPRTGGAFDPSVTAVPRRKPAAPAAVPKTAPEIGQETAPEIGQEISEDPATPPAVREVGPAPGRQVARPAPAPR